MTRTLSILGSTGSIGRQSLEVAAHLGLPVTALCAGSNVELLEDQVRRFRPVLCALADEEAAKTLRLRLADTPVRVLSGPRGVEEIAADDSDTVVTAMSGAAGLLPTMAAIEKGKRIALANKETLVCAGGLVMAAAERCGAEIVPVDSEHSAIFQCLQGGGEPARILLTASGGPFRGWSPERLRTVRKEDALRHPNWTMGAKITIDSATLMNKGLELIEAMHLFHVGPEQIRVLIHPQSVIHSAVEFRDGSVIAQCGVPDMRLPIQYALTWPERMPGISPAVDLIAMSPLTFEEPDLTAFPCLALAMETAKRGETVRAAMNAANETAVHRFLRDEIAFPHIHRIAAEVVARVAEVGEPTLEDILAADREARDFAEAWRS